MHKASRRDHLEYEILSDSRPGKIEIHFVAGQDWPCQAGSSRKAGSSGGRFPVFKIEGDSYTLHRERLDPQSVSSGHRFVLRDSEDAEMASATCPNTRAGWIEFQNQKYRLQNLAWFSYSFRLRRDATDVASFVETTKFWSFSIRRDFALETREELDPILLTFSFAISRLLVGV